MALLFFLVSAVVVLVPVIMLVSSFSLAFILALAFVLAFSFPFFNSSAFFFCIIFSLSIANLSCFSSIIFMLSFILVLLPLAFIPSLPPLPELKNDEDEFLAFVFVCRKGLLDELAAPATFVLAVVVD